MDGALVDPVPVTAARALGAEIVIAVNLSGAGYGRGTVIQDFGGESEFGSYAEAVARDQERGLPLRCARRRPACAISSGGGEAPRVSPR